MADNYVSIRIKANDDAKPDLTDLKAKLDELSHKVATARAEVDDKQADATLAALDLKLKRIADKVVDPKIKLRGADRALAELLAVDVGMDRLKEKADRLRAEADVEAVKGGILSRLLGGGGGGLGGLLGKIPGIPDAGSGGGLPVQLGAIGLIVDALGAASTEITGLVSGFAAAGAGAGAFYLLAHPAISNLMQDYQKLSGAQSAYQQAQNKYSLDPTKANAKALQTAAENLKAVNMSMSQDAGGAAGGLMKLRTEYDKLSTAFKPEAFKVFNGFLQLANELLPHAAPFANIFADALGRLLGDAGRFAGSKGFTDWLDQFRKLEGPSIGAIGTGIGHVVTSIGKLFTIMSAKDVVNSINIAFSVIDGAIIGFGGFVRGAMITWDGLTAAWRWGEAVARRTGHDIAASWDFVRHAAAELGHDVASSFDQMRHDIAAQVGAEVSWVRDHWKQLVASVLDPMGVLVATLHARWGQVTHDTASAWDRVRHDTASAWDHAQHAVLLAATAMIRAADGMARRVIAAVSDVLSWYERLPGRIVSALASLPGMLFRAGQNAINGLLKGAESMIGSVLSSAGNWGHDIANAIGGAFGIHFSEPSEATQMVKAGRNVALGLAKGMTGGRSSVEQAARVIGAAGMAHAAYGGGHGGAEVVIRLEGDDVLIRWLRNQIRVKGGSVQTVLGAG